jgi:competence protein ComEA
VDYRNANGNFATIEDIMNVSGIGEGRFNDISGLITVGDINPPSPAPTATSTAAPVPTEEAAPALININTATIEELTTLPGIGEATAANIIAYREANGLFATIEDLVNVPGIGEAKLNTIRDLITVGDVIVPTMSAEVTLIDLNTATIEQLMTLPGVGEALAQRILAYRDSVGVFRSVDELLNVSGIGDANLEAIRPFVTVSERKTLFNPTATPALIDLNRATVEQLMTLPGIGQTTAQAIVDYRTRNGNFRRLEDLDNVPGVGAATIERLRPYVIVVDFSGLD